MWLGRFGMVSRAKLTSTTDISLFLVILLADSEDPDQTGPSLTAYARRHVCFVVFFFLLFFFFCFFFCCFFP